MTSEQSIKNILSIKNLTLSINNNKLLDSISFNIKEGEIFALIGESGSGKSLTSLAIMRLLPDVIDVNSGDIKLNENSLFLLPEYEMQKVRGSKIAMIFQEPMSALNPVMTVGEQVAEAIKVHLNINAKDIKKKVISLFKEVALKDPKQRYSWYPHQLSGGQKQRVMIAMALACEPELLIADEPTTALDVTIQAQVLQLLKEIQKKRSLSILFITHDMGVVSQVANRIGIMRNGKLLEQAEAKEFFSNPQHPYSKALIEDSLLLSSKKLETKQLGELLNVKSLKVHFPIKKGFFQRTTNVLKAVDDVSFNIQKGETLALVGESGSGKSTIGKAILSLVGIDGGVIEFEGKTISTLKESELKEYRKKIQVIFQDPFSALNPRMTIGDIIREGMVSLKVSSKNRKEQDAYIVELLEKVELSSEHIHRYPHEFSGGQRQRIGIARALAVEPELIICDEPTSALDVSVRTQVLKLLKDLQKQRGLSYLFITHDLSIIPSVANRVAIMKEGKIVEQGLVDDVMNNPQHPYTKTLLESAPKYNM